MIILERVALIVETGDESRVRNRKGASYGKAYNI